MKGEMGIMFQPIKNDVEYFSKIQKEIRNKKYIFIYYSQYLFSYHPFS